MASSGGKGVIRYHRFVPGLEFQLPADQLQIGQAVVASNVNLTHNTVIPRNGWTPYLGGAPLIASTRVSDLFTYNHGASGETVMQMCGNSLFQDNVLISGTFFAGAVLPLQCQAVEANGSVYIASNDSNYATQAVQKYNGTTLVATASPATAGGAIAYFNNALWLSGMNSSKPSRVFWSGVAGQSGIDVWPANNFVDINPDDGDNVKAFGSLHNALLVLKQNSIWRVTGQPPDDASLSAGTLSVISLGTQSGCWAPSTVSSLGNKVMWLNQRGLFMYDGTQVREMAEPLRPLWTLLASTTQKLARGAWINWNQYMLIAPLAAGGTTVVVLTLVPHSLVQWAFTAPDISAVLGDFGTGASVSGLDQAAFLGFQNGAVGRFDGTQHTDNGAAIPWNYTTGILPMGSWDNVNVASISYVRTASPGTSDTLNLTLRADGVDSTTSFVPGVTAGNTVTTTRVLLPNIGRAHQLILSGTSAAGSLEVHGAEIAYRSLPRG